MTEKERALNFLANRWEDSKREIESYDSRFWVDEGFDFSVQKGKIPDFTIIFCTSSGVFLWDSKKGVQKKILNGKFYGATKKNNIWFFARSNNEGVRDHLKNDRISDICLVKFSGNKPVACKPVVFGIPGEVHQIDIINDKLIIPHTDFNQLILFNLDHILYGPYPKSIKEAEFYEFDASPFSHVNSIYATRKYYYLVAHNFTWKTRVESELIRFSIGTGSSARASLNAKSAHNYVPWRGSYFLCDSERGLLRLGKKVFFKSDTFLRGFSMNDRHLFVGGSDINYNQTLRRGSQNCILFILDTYENLISEIILCGLGDIYEIRQFDVCDYAMSDLI